MGRRARIPLHVIDNAVDNATSVEEARAMFFDNLVTRSGSPIRASVHGSDYSDPQMQVNAIGDALYSKMTGTAPTGPARELVHRSTIGLMEHHARITGLPLRSANPAEIYQTVMQTRGGGMLTTSDFQTVLGNTMQRRLGEVFTAAQSGASAIVATGTVNDFRPTTEVRTTSFPSLERLNESGEIKFGALDETGEPLAISSFARGTNVSFQLAINDDLGALDRGIRDIGFAAAMLKGNLIVAALSAVMSDGKALFHIDHKNMVESGGGAPDEATLSAGRIAMMKQTPPGSTEPLGLSPAILLVPAELQTESEKLVAAINPASSSDVNVFSGKLQVAVEPRLPDDAQWFLFAAPGTYPVIRFLTLAGFEGPRFETNAEFDRLGTSYRVHWHCGAGPVDFRGAWKNPG
jgi:hypothetical protein